jgi:hypothetical protein
MNARSSRSVKDTRYKCPFCKADQGKRDKYYLSLNTKDEVFKCWVCGESGGVLKFMALLQNTSIEEVKRQLRGPSNTERKLHPAEKLTPAQLKDMGMIGPSWYQLRQRDYSYYRRVLDWTWEVWQEHVVEQKRDAYIFFCLAESSQGKVQVCQEAAKSLFLSATDLIIEFAAYAVGSKKKPEWATSAERFISSLKPSQKTS